jgi:hypothetical protein|nr:YiaA/YiaB family inner membrane protein [Neorhizobium tomejilense]
MSAQHSSNWVNFIYVSFLTAILMTGTGVFFLPADLWAKGFLAMGIVMIIMTSISLTKTIRDNQDTSHQQYEK